MEIVRNLFTLPRRSQYQLSTRTAHDTESISTDANSTLDVIKYGRWVGNPVFQKRRMGLPEDVIRNDCQQIQEKRLFRGSFRTYWPENENQ